MLSAMHMETQARCPSPSTKPVVKNKIHFYFGGIFPCLYWDTLFLKQKGFLAMALPLVVSVCSWIWLVMVQVRVSHRYHLKGRWCCQKVPLKSLGSWISPIARVACWVCSLLCIWDLRLVPPWLRLCHCKHKCKRFSVKGSNFVLTHTRWLVSHPM